MTEFKFKYNEIVEICRTGEIYPKYDTMAREMRLEEWVEGGRNKNRKGLEGMVIAKHPHLNTGKPLYGILVLYPEKEHIIIGEEGLKSKLRMKESLPEELFNI